MPNASRRSEKGTADLFFRVSDSAGIYHMVTGLRTDARVVRAPLYLLEAPSNLRTDNALDITHHLVESTTRAVFRRNRIENNAIQIEIGEKK
jgi:hypothetical protein